MEPNAGPEGADAAFWSEQNKRDLGESAPAGASGVGGKPGRGSASAQLLFHSILAQGE